LVSHLHFDHLHLPSLRKLDPRTRLLAPQGTARILARTRPALSVRVEEVTPGDVIDLGGVVIRAVPAVHDGRRHPLSHHGGPALGFVIDGVKDFQDPTRVWFAGDTGLFAGMTDLWPVDVAVIPVGGWGPTLGPTHLDPTQAAEAVRRVGANDAIPIHYGTFWPTGLRLLNPRVFQQRFVEPGTRFATALNSCCPTSTPHLLNAGGTATVVDPGHHDRRP
jgi:L-ascorbate metabolism protein UlaG (beta-lactamase superfamily)